MIGTPNKQAEKTKTVDHCGPVTLANNNDNKLQNPHNLKICDPCPLKVARLVHHLHQLLLDNVGDLDQQYPDVNLGNVRRVKRYERFF